jgi:hypothetical protein
MEPLTPTFGRNYFPRVCLMHTVFLKGKPYVNKRKNIMAENVAHCQELSRRGNRMIIAMSCNNGMLFQSKAYSHKSFQQVVDFIQ